MKKIFILLMLLPLATFAAEKWEITFITGTVEVKPLKGTSWTACKTGRILSNDSIIRTGPGSSVTLEQNGRQLAIEADSIFSLKSLGKSDSKRAQLSLASTNRLLKKIINKNAYRSEISGVRGKKVAPASSDEPAWSDDLPDEGDSGHLERANRCFKTGNDKCVLSVLEKNYSTYSGEQKDRASYMLGTACFHLALYDKSRDYLATASQSAALGEEERLSADLKYALSLMFLGDLDGAAKELEILIRENPETVQKKEALFFLGNIYYMLGNDTRALHCYKMFLNEYPGDELVPEVQRVRATLK